MGFRNENLTLIVDDEPQEFQSYTYSYPHLSTRQCRICHEEEQEQQNSIGDMEAPCSCSGTVMFAHRNCIQKWCDEKGSTLCEICLKNFEPGYTFVPKEAVEIDVSEVLPNDDGVLQDRETPMNRTGYQFAMGHLECFRAVVWYRSIVITLAIFLMLRHTISIVSLGHALNPYVLYYILLLRTFGILVPFYVVIRLISEAQHISR